MSEWTQYNVAVTFTDFAQPTEARAKLDEYLQNGADGWICTTHQVERVRAGGRVLEYGGARSSPPLHVRERVSESGRVLDYPLLAAELRLDAQSTAHLRTWGHGWRIWIIREVEGPPDGTPSGPKMCRGVDDGLLSVENSKLKYRVYWAQRPEGDPQLLVWRPWCARFLGWED